MTAAADPGRHPWRPDVVRVGTVGRAHGLDGSFSVESPCGWFPFRPGTDVLVDGRPAVVRRRAGTDARPLVALAGVGDRSAAEDLRGRPIELRRDQLPEPEPDAYFHFDLVGCAVVCGAVPLGHVRAVEDGVVHDVLLLDDDEQTRIPFVAALVPVVDIRARRIEIVEGLV